MIKKSLIKKALKKIIFNLLLYVILEELLFIAGWQVIEGLDRCPIYVYQNSIKK